VPATSAHEERKIVTVLFADLVGFTSRSEKLDPEDVRAFLSPYYTRLRRELEGYGGTVEKFIGDAVMAIFGAPVAHEDDPERAVRAALAIRDWMMEQEGEFQLRIGVNTGEALVALGARPSEGEGMASGDVVNTAARLQTASPVNGILVSDATYRATSHVITYRSAEPVTAKGKALPVPAWEALEARSRFGIDLAPARLAPLVGRGREVTALTEGLQRARDDRTTQLVTLVGVPGMGKSRLVGELFRVVDEEPDELIAWRQGRSLPYGDGVTFWALGEMVKAQAGILDTDSSAAVAEKLETAVAGLIPEAVDAAWVEGHLRPLAGLGSPGFSSGSDRREETFAAWRRFLEAVAEKGPLVLVFEDLHWADDNLLDFIEYLVEWADGVPLLVVCTARPELFERRSSWGGGTRNSATLWLKPLSDSDTAHMISSLSDRPVMDAKAQQTLLEQAGGNPLYAEQFVRMLEERGDVGASALPETVQGIIAARLDALPADEKRLLQTAAVIGKVFWVGSLEAVGGFEREGAERHLHALERKDFVRRARRSSVGDDTEYAFLHVLVRDVAYGQIPRMQRAEQHQLTAEWISSLVRTDDQLEMLAHHYRTAIDLRRLAGQTVPTELAERAMTCLRDAGDRAFALNAYPSAESLYATALELAPAGSIEHARLLRDVGRSQGRAGESGLELIAKAVDELLACGDREGAAEAEAIVAARYGNQGDRAMATEHLARSLELLKDGPPSREKASTLNHIAGTKMMSGENAESIRLARDALEIIEQLGLHDMGAWSLGTIAAARFNSGDADGIEDFERSFGMAVAMNEPLDQSQIKNNLASAYWQLGQLQSAFTLFEEAEEIASHFGLGSTLRFMRGDRAVYEYCLGRWREALEGTNKFLAEVEAGSPHIQASACYLTRAGIRLGRDEASGSRADVGRAIDLARRVGDPQFLYPALAEGAYILRELSDASRARELAIECLEGLSARKSVGYEVVSVHILSWTLVPLGLGSELVDALPAFDSAWIRAARSFATGDLRRASDTCAEIGAVTEEARDRLWLAEVLCDQGRLDEAGVELGRALIFYRSVGATRYIRHAETLQRAIA
jgi:class 3 adenylate cyclase/tetratricopeptide (TPR) repeat protein